MTDENIKLLKTKEHTSIYIKDGKLMYDAFINDYDPTRTYYKLMLFKPAKYFIIGQDYLITFPMTKYYSIEKLVSVSDIQTPGIREIFLGDKGTLTALDNVNQITAIEPWNKLYTCSKTTFRMIHDFLDFINNKDLLDKCTLIESDINIEASKVDPMDCCFANYMMDHKHYQTSTKNWPVKNINIEKLRMIPAYKDPNKQFDQDGIKRLAQAIQEDDKKTQIIREFLKNVVTSQYDLEDYKEFTKDLF